MKYNSVSAGAFAPIGEFPDYPMLYPRRVNVGESRRILSNQALTLQKVCYMVPEVEFPDVDEEFTEQVRRGLVQTLWTSEDAYGSAEWAYEAHRAFMDWDGFGIGGTRIGVEDGSVGIYHHRIVDTIWDRHAWNPGRSRYVAFIHHMPTEEAIEVFGSSVKGHETTFGADDQYTENKFRRVKVVEWRDIGIGKSNPTVCYFLNQIGGKVLHVGSNDFECINWAYGTHIHFPGMERPMGRVDMQLGSQEFRNALERLIKLSLARGSGFDLGDQGDINPEDLNALMSGAVLPFVRVTPRDGKPANSVIGRIAPQDIAPGVFNMLQYVDREMAGESGNSDADRANLSLDKRTLGENVMAKEGADIQTAWSRRQYAEFQRRLWHKVFKIAGKFHTKPITVNVLVEGKSADYTLNNPEDPRSALSEWLSEPSRIIVNEDALQYQDASMKAMQQLAMWKEFFSDPWTNQAELRKVVFAGMGRKNVQALIDPTGQSGIDPEILMQQQMQAAAMQGQPPAA